jgi:hypothetical protein
VDLVQPIKGDVGLRDLRQSIKVPFSYIPNCEALTDTIIDSGRGPLGAILLLFRTKGRSLAALGAVIIVLLLAIDSFFQQVVTTPNRWTLQSIPGTLPRVTNYRPPYTPVYFNYGYESTGVDIRLSAIWREFLAGNGTQSVPFGNGTRPDIPLTCPTNNCTWPLYETLAVCSSCADVTEKIGPTYACLNTTTIEWSTAWYGPLDKFPYPNGTVCGYFLNATSSAPILLSGYVLPPNGSVTAGEALIVRAVPLTDFDTRMPYYADGSVNFKNISMPILDALISAVESGAKGVYNKEVPVVRECMLAWCVQTMKSSYTSGTYQEETLSTYVEPALPTDPFPWSHQVYDDGIELFYPKDLVIRPPNPRQHGADVVTANETYQIQNQTQMNAMMFFDDIFPSFYTAANISAQPRLRYKNYPDGSSVREMDFNPWQYSNISRHMERMATAFTNSIRSSESKTMLEGNAYQVEPYISVQWEWLAFPIALLILTLVFLICTIIRTSGDDATGIWKTSTMPTLIYSLPKETQRQFASPSTWGSGKGAPRKTRIKLLPNMGWRISGQSYLNRSPKLPSGESVPHGWI